MSKPVRIAVLVSGGGTTLQNLLERIADGKLNAQVVLAISSKPQAAGLERAMKARIRAEVVERLKFSSTEEFSLRIFSLCREANADLACLAGFLQLIDIPGDFQGR